MQDANPSFLVHSTPCSCQLHSWSGSEETHGKQGALFRNKYDAAGDRIGLLNTILIGYSTISTVKKMYFKNIYLAVQPTSIPEQFIKNQYSKKS